MLFFKKKQVPESPDMGYDGNSYNFFGFLVIMVAQKIINEQEVDILYHEINNGNYENYQRIIRGGRYEGR